MAQPLVDRLAQRAAVVVGLPRRLLARERVEELAQALLGLLGRQVPRVRRTVGGAPRRAAAWCAPWARLRPQIDRLRRNLLERDLAPRTVAKAMVAAFGIFERARRLRWVAANPATDAERVALKTSCSIAVLDPEAVLAIAAACPVPWHGSAIRFSAFTGLRLDEL